MKEKIFSGREKSFAMAVACLGRFGLQPENGMRGVLFGLLDGGTGACGACHSQVFAG
jgi:hypothetical protein